MAVARTFNTKTSSPTTRDRCFSQHERDTTGTGWDARRPTFRQEVITRATDHAYFCGCTKVPPLVGAAWQPRQRRLPKNGINHHHTNIALRCVRACVLACLCCVGFATLSDMRSGACISETRNHLERTDARRRRRRQRLSSEHDAAAVAAGRRLRTHTHKCACTYVCV